MRFRFCGDGDCPDWILVQINTLARMSSIKMKLLCQEIADSTVEDSPLNYEKIKKLTADAKFDENEVRASVSALRHILTSAAKYGITEATLANELQQIGFPREHGQALCRVYSERVAALMSQLARQSLRTSRLIDVATHRQGTGCTLVLTYYSGETGQTHKQTFTASDTQIAVLLHDLKICSEKLEQLEKEL